MRNQQIKNYFDGAPDRIYHPCVSIRPIRSTVSLSTISEHPKRQISKSQADQISISGSELDSLRAVKGEHKKKRHFVTKKHEVCDIMELGMLIDSGADAHMVTEGMFDLPVNTEKAHGFETADGTEMASPGTQYIPGYV